MTPSSPLPQLDETESPTIQSSKAAKHQAIASKDYSPEALGYLSATRGESLEVISDKFPADPGNHYDTYVFAERTADNIRGWFPHALLTVTEEE